MKELYINNVLVPLSEEVAIPLTKSIADIAEPENRSSAYTKTITIPGSKEINKLFGYIFDVSQAIINESDTTNFLPDFNPNLKASCRIYEDKFLQLEGYAQLLQINITGQQIEYEVAVFGQLANLFSSIGTGKLTDLDFSQYEHTWEKSKITESWDTQIRDNTAFGGIRAFEYGRGYVYPLIDYGQTQDIKNMQSSWFAPALYAKTIVDKIFAAAGQTYTSDSFFNTDFFKHLIIPYTGTGFVLTPAQLEERKIIFGSDGTGTANTTIGALKLFEDETLDTFNQYTPATGKVIFSKEGFYVFSGWLQIVDHNLPTTLTLGTDLPYQVQILVMASGFIIDVIEFNVWSSPNKESDIVYFETPEIYYSATDEVSFLLWSVVNLNNNTAYFGTYNIEFIGGVNVVATKGIPLHEPVDMNGILSGDILQKDFLIWFNRMFNLYWDSTDIDKVMRILPRDVYYDTDTVNDYTKKLDISKPINVIPMGELDANPYHWTYKEDKDFYNDLYKKEFNRIYGDFKFYVNNDFIKEPKKIEVGFSPSVLVSEPQWQSDMVVSSIKAYDGKGNYAPMGGNIRVLYYAGLLPTATGFNIIEEHSAEIFTDYPFAGHVDDPYNSTLDLNFGTPLKLYYGTRDGSPLTYTGNNLFVTWWETFINEITNKDSKIVKAWFRLRALDIFQMDFSNAYYFMGQFFKINKMFDHDIAVESMTQLEFLKAGSGIVTEPSPEPPPPPVLTYAIWDSGAKGTHISLSGGGLIATADGGGTGEVRSNMGKSSGKWYWEVTPSAIPSATLVIGIDNGSGNVNQYTGQNINTWGYFNPGDVLHNGGFLGNGEGNYLVGDVVGIALDMDNLTVEFYVNGLLESVAPIAIPAGTYYAAVGDGGSATVTTANFGPTLAFAPPAGFNTGLYT